MTNPVSKALKALVYLKNGDNERQQHDVYKRSFDFNEQETPVLTKKMLWSLFKKHSPSDYEINETNKNQIYTILRYFMNDPNFDKERLVKSQPSINKGLLVFGDFGVGKSLLFQIIQNCGKELIMNYGINDVWFSSISCGSFVDDYMSSTKENTNFNYSNYQKGKLYIDDLGFEKKAFNKTELLENLLFERHRNSAITHVTTNLTPSEIAQRYGGRIGDRLPEMFNIIKWEGESFRHKKSN